VRQYAEERLEERGEDRVLQDRHAEFFIALAERSEQEIHRPTALDVMNVLDREHDNIRVALRRLFSNHDVERSQRLAGAMGRFWLYRSHVAEGEAWLRRALDMPGGEAPTLSRAKCIAALPVFAHMRSDEAALEQASQEELSLFRELGEQGLEGFALLHVGQAFLLREERAEARRYFEAGLAVSLAVGNSASETMNRVWLANVAFDEGLDDEARKQAEAALATASEGGWTRGLVQAHRALARVCHRQGEHERARTLLESSLEFSRKFGARWWISGTLLHLGSFAVDQGEVDNARQWLSEGLDLARELGDRRGMIEGLEAFAELAELLGEPVGALRLHAAADGVRHSRALPDQSSVDYAYSL
jgi:tetratricopeptide (TPR) repeat protein